MEERKPFSAAKAVVCALLLMLAVAAVVMGVRVSNLNAQVQHERSLTPTPIPDYKPNMMAVTPDPSQAAAGQILRTGSTGEKVVELQTRLKELGYYSGEADGQFGPATETAVRLFQQQNALDVDGRVGTATSSVLYSDAARPFTPTPTPAVFPVTAETPAPTSAYQSENHRIQARLKELGYYTGAVDGSIGPESQMAIRLFQQQHGLQVDGIAGNDTKAALYAADAQPRITPAPGQQPGMTADGMPLLVNREHALPDGYLPQELVLMRSYCDNDVVTIKGSEIQGERVAVDALMQMLQAAHADGLTVWQISAGYRSVEYQQQLFNDTVYTYRQSNMTRSQAEAEARKTVADPGHSEHHLGLAFDVTVPGEQFSNTQQSVWLAQHCWEYGFIIRYPLDKVDITGFSYEPWHIRYVGVEHSLIMQAENLCLEEYLEKYGE